MKSRHGQSFGMSAIGTKRTMQPHQPLSAFGQFAAIGRSFGLEIDGLNHAPPFADVGSKHCLSRFLIEVERLKAIFGSSAGGSPHFVDNSSSEAGQSTPAGGHRTRDTDV